MLWTLCLTVFTSQEAILKPFWWILFNLQVAYTDLRNCCASLHQASKKDFFVFFIMVDRVTKLRFARKNLFSLLLWILDLFLQWFRNVLYRGKSMEILEQQVYYKEIGYSSTSFPVLLWNECHISWKLNIVRCTEYQWTCRFEWSCYKQIFGNSAWLQ